MFHHVVFIISLLLLAATEYQRREDVYEQSYPPPVNHYTPKPHSRYLHNKGQRTGQSLSNRSPLTRPNYALWFIDPKDSPKLLVSKPSSLVKTRLRDPYDPNQQGLLGDISQFARGFGSAALDDFKGLGEFVVAPITTTANALTGVKNIIVHPVASVKSMIYASSKDAQKNGYWHSFGRSTFTAASMVGGVSAAGAIAGVTSKLGQTGVLASEIGVGSVAVSTAAVLSGITTGATYGSIASSAAYFNADSKAYGQHQMEDELLRENKAMGVSGMDSSLTAKDPFVDTMDATDVKNSRESQGQIVDSADATVFDPLRSNSVGAVPQLEPRTP